jgi:hypothetical protein
MRWFTEKAGFFGFVLVCSLVFLALQHYLGFFGDIEQHWIWAAEAGAAISAFILVLAAVQR